MKCGLILTGGRMDLTFAGEFLRRHEAEVFGGGAGAGRPAEGEAVGGAVTGCPAAAGEAVSSAGSGYPAAVSTSEGGAVPACPAAGASVGCAVAGCPAAAGKVVSSAGSGYPAAVSTSEGNAVPVCPAASAPMGCAVAGCPAAAGEAVSSVGSGYPAAVSTSEGGAVPACPAAGESVSGVMSVCPAAAGEPVGGAVPACPGGPGDRGWTAGYDCVICVDAGLERAEALGLRPTAVVGDLDTVGPEVLARYQNEKGILWEVRRPEKDETDTELAVGTAIRLGCGRLEILGATGGRLDHELSNIQLLKTCMDAGVEAALYDAQNRVSLLKGGRVFRRAAAYGRYVSFIPLTERVTDIRLTGFRYSLSGKDISIGHEAGLCISNEIAAETAEIRIGEGILICVESKD